MSRIGRVRVEQSGSPVFREAQPIDDSGLRIPLTAFQRQRATWNEYIAWVNKQPGNEFVAPGVTWAQWAEDLHTYDAVYQREFAGKLADATCPQISPEADEITVVESVDLRGFSPPIEKPYHEWTASVRRKANLAALALLRKIEADGRSATESERAKLRWFSGWGGLRPQDLPLDPAIFDEDYLAAIAEWKKVEEARRRGTMYVPRSNLFEGILQQFFTPMPLAEGMWRLIARSGVESLSVESILEPSAGSGRLIEAKGDRYEHVPVQLVEMDPLLQRIEAAVYPNASRWAGPFETFASSARKFKAVYDIIIGNPPYPVRSKTDIAMDPAGESWKRASTYFEAMALSLSGPGTVICLLNPIGHITATSTTSEQRRLRRLMLQRCQLVTAVAPPSDVFPGADLNLAIYLYVVLPKSMWGEDRLNDPEIRAIVEGRYFELHPENVIGTWTEVSSKFGREIKVRGSITVEDFDRVTINPISSNVLDAIREARTDEAITEARKTAAAGFNDSASGLVQSAAERAQTVSLAMGLASAEVDSAVHYDDILKTSAKMLASRIGVWLDRLASHREWANRARLELFLDVADMAHAVNVWTDPRVAGPEYDQLRRVIERDGTVHEILATGASPRVVAPRVDSAADAIRWYSQRYELCATTDLIRHGYSEAAGIDAVLADATLMFEWQSEGVRFFRWEDYLSGDLWARVDAIDTALGDSEDRSPEIISRLSDARVAIMSEVSPLPISQIKATPRDTFVPLEVKSAFANWWIYRAPVPQRVRTGTLTAGTIPTTKEIIVGDPPYDATGAYAVKVILERIYRIVPAVGNKSLHEFFRVKGDGRGDYTAQAMRAEFYYGYLNGLTRVAPGIIDPTKASDIYGRNTEEKQSTKKKDKAADPSDEPVPDMSALRQAEDAEIAKLFMEWLGANPEFAKMVETGYNRAYRGIGNVRSYSEDPIAFARIPSGFSLRAYQNAGVRRLNERGGGILAFTVGLGKTFSGGATIALGRQEGTIRRAMVVVPDAVPVNWRNEMLVMLPEYRTCLMGATQVIKRDAKGNIVDASRYRSDTKAERVAKWRAFKDGLYDLLIVRFTHFLNDIAMYDENILPIIENDVVLAQVGALDEESAKAIQAKIDKLQKELDAVRKEITRVGSKSSGYVGELQERETKILQALQKAAKAKAGVSNSVVERVRQSLEAITSDKPFRPSYTPKAVKKSMTRAQLIDLADEVGIADAITTDMTDEDVFLTLSELLAGDDTAPGAFPHLVYFEDLGIDYLVVDEAHNFKNLYQPASGHAETIEFLPTSEDPMGGTVIRPWDLYLKTQYLLANNNDRGVTLLTGTPVKNSPIEIYNLLRFVSRKVWQQRAIATPDEFVRRFLQIEIDWTSDTAGTLEQRHTLRGWNRTTFPDLQAIFRVFLERRSQADLEEVKRKEGQAALEEFRRSFPEAVPHDIKFDLDPVQERVFEPIRACIAAATTFDPETCAIVRAAPDPKIREEVASKYGISIEALLRLLQPVGMFNTEGDSETDDQEPIDHLLIVDILSKASVDVRLLEIERRDLAGEGSGKKKGVALVKAKYEAIAASNRAKFVPDPTELEFGTPEFWEAMARPEVRREMKAMRALRAAKRKLDLLDLLGVQKLAAQYNDRIIPARYLELAKKIRENPSCGHVVFCDYASCIPTVRAVIANVANIPLNRIGVIIGSDTMDVEGRKVRGTPAPMRQATSDAFNGSDARNRPDGGQDPARDPSLSVVIGTTAAMGEGINLQRRTCAVHHLNLPWEPASVEQRNGRGARQGNQIGIVNLYYYLQRGSFDAFKRNKVMGKQSWITALWLGMSGDVEGPADEAGGGADRTAEIVELLYYKEDPETQALKARILECFRKMKEIARAAAIRAAVIQGWEQASALWGRYRYTLAAIVASGKETMNDRDRADLESQRDAALRASMLLRDNPAFTRTDLLDILESEPVVWEPDTDRVLRIGDWIQVRLYMGKDVYVAGKGRVFERSGDAIPKVGDYVVIEDISREGRPMCRAVGSLFTYPKLFPLTSLDPREYAMKPHEVVWNHLPTDNVIHTASSLYTMDATNRRKGLRRMEPYEASVTPNAFTAFFPGTWNGVARSIRPDVLDAMWEIYTVERVSPPLWWAEGSVRTESDGISTIMPLVPVIHRDTGHIHLLQYRPPGFRSREAALPERIADELRASYTGFADPRDTLGLDRGFRQDTLQIVSLAGIPTYDQYRYRIEIPWFASIKVMPISDSIYLEIIKRTGGLYVTPEESESVSPEIVGISKLASVWYPYGRPSKVALKTGWDLRRTARGESVPEDEDAPSAFGFGAGQPKSPFGRSVAHVDQHARFREPEPPGDAPLFIRRR